MKISREFVDRSSSVLLFTPLLLPRITASTGYEIIIYGATFFFIFFAQVRSMRFSAASIVSLFSAVALLQLAMISSLVQGYPVDHRVLMFVATLILFACLKPNADLAHGLYGLTVISVPLAVLMSFATPVGFIIPASTYSVFGVERVTFFFFEPSHYAIVLALAFGIGMVLDKPRWMQLTLLSGVGATFSGSGIITLLAVYLLNQSRVNGSLKALAYGIPLLLISVILLRFLMQYDSSGVIVTRVNQFVTGITEGFEYSSTGVRLASALAGINFLSEAFQGKDAAAILLGVGFDGLPTFVAGYFNDFFSEEVENAMIFNFLSAAIISSGLLGFIIYLVSVNNIRQCNRIGLLRWLFLIVFLSLTHGYLYGPLAFIFMVFSGFSISNLPDGRDRGLSVRVPVRIRQNDQDEKS